VPRGDSSSSLLPSSMAGELVSSFAVTRSYRLAQACAVSSLEAGSMHYERAALFGG
jgi:hypothetical protein